MIEQQIEELKAALAEFMQFIQQRDPPLTGELRLMIAQVMEHVGTRIQQLRQQEQAPTDGLTPPPPEEPPIGQAMPSSNIFGFGYDPENGRLLVKFQGNDGAGQGPVYGYEGVPKVIFELFKKGGVPASTDGQNKWGKWLK